MSEVGDIVKILIEKGGFKTLLASILGAILFYKLILDDWLWALGILCGCYLLFSFFIYIKDLIKIKREVVQKKTKETKKLEQEKIDRYNRLCIVYNSLPQRTKQTLIKLYKLPQQNDSNVRIINNVIQQNDILQACRNVQLKHHVISVEESIGSYIIHIEDIFCDVLAEHISDSD